MESKNQLSITSDEIILIKQSKVENQRLPLHIEEKIKSLVENFSSEEKNEDDICCNYYSNGDRYVKTSKQNCNAIGGTVVDSSACAT